MDWVALAIAMAIVAGVAVFIVIPVLVYLLYRRRRRRSFGSSQSDLSLELGGRERIPAAPRRSEVKRLDSLPCRLKKSRAVSSNGTGSAGESGVYDMTDYSNNSEFKNDRVMVSFITQSGVEQKLSFFGHLTTEDILMVKSLTSNYLQNTNNTASVNNCTSQDTANTASANNCTSQDTANAASANKSMNNESQSQVSLDDLVITGLSSNSSTSAAYVNEAYQQGEPVERKQSKKVSHSFSFSSLGRKRKIRKLERIMSSQSSIADRRRCHLVSKTTDVIGYLGGEITLEGGIRLHIPLNALPDAAEITLGVTFDPDHKPELAQGLAMLTPVVFCEPVGLTFKEPVTLSLPHSGESLQENWRVNILRSDTESHSSSTEWRALQIGEYDSRVFNKRSVDLCINSLSMYCLTGSPKADKSTTKRTKLIALSTNSQISHLSVYCVSDYQASTREEDDSSLLIAPNGQSVRLGLEHLTDGWIHTNPHQNTIDYKDIWEDNNQGTTLEFSTKTSPNDSLSSFPYVDINAWQIDNITRKHKISVHPPQQNGASPVRAVKKRDVFAETLRWDIMLLLDPVHPDGNDWRKLSGALGFADHTIREMEEKSSPTKELLRIWEEKGHGCIKSFVAMAVKINRLDVAEKIESYVGKLYLETLTNHKCDDHC